MNVYRVIFPDVYSIEIFFYKWQVVTGRGDFLSAPLGGRAERGGVRLTVGWGSSSVTRDRATHRFFFGGGP